MHLRPPSQAPVVELVDVYGQPITLGTGKPVLLSFFRDAACPFCNMRIFELTWRYEGFARHGLDVIVVFASTEDEVRRFVMKRPRPFRVAAEPARLAYETYGVESSFVGKLKAIVFRFGTLLRGLRLVGLAGFATNNVMPADFLIDDKGRIVEAYYGRDAGDRIPFERVESFLVGRGVVGSELRATAG